jgi:formamidase
MMSAQRTAMLTPFEAADRAHRRLSTYPGRHEVRIDRSKPLAADPGTGHNRWHPDIPQICGPVSISGAHPGDLLDIEILDIELDSYGYTTQVPGFGFLRDLFPSRSRSTGTSPTGGQPRVICLACASPAHRLWAPLAWLRVTSCLAPSLPANRRCWTVADSCCFPSAASAVPSDPEIAAHGLRTIPPETAGNVDIKQLSKGAHLLIPVDAPGALFSARDAHYAQGNCETCGTAIEMTSTLHVRFISLRKGEAAQKGIRHPRFYRQDYYLAPEFAAPRRFYATTGLSVTRDGVDQSEDVSLAARNALLNMIDHLTERGWSPQQG